MSSNPAPVLGSKWRSKLDCERIANQHPREPRSQQNVSISTKAQQASRGFERRQKAWIAKLRSALEAFDLSSVNLEVSLSPCEQVRMWPVECATLNSKVQARIRRLVVIFAQWSGNFQQLRTHSSLFAFWMGKVSLGEPHSVSVGLGKFRSASVSLSQARSSSSNKPIKHPRRPLARELGLVMQHNSNVSSFLWAPLEGRAFKDQGNLFTLQVQVPSLSSTFEARRVGPPSCVNRARRSTFLHTNCTPTDPPT